jgi:parallel beta-helix repeat protein
MIKQRLFRDGPPGLLLLCTALAAALLFTMGAPPEARAQCACNDGLCNNVSRAYYVFGETINESCHFTADVTRPAGNYSYGFMVTGNGITIDGSGYRLDGVSTSNALVGANGIYVSKYYGAANVTIRNLEVTNFWQGIKASGNNEADPIIGIVIDNCTVHDNGVLNDTNKYEGIWLDIAQNSEIKNCRIYNNRQGSGIANGVGDHNYFHDNEIYNNFKYGIKAWWGSEYIYSVGNSVHGNGYGGIGHVSGDSNHGRVWNNTATGNTGAGISVAGSENSIVGNVSTGNVDGAEIDPSNGEPYEKGNGISLSSNTSGSTATLSSNTACGNATNRNDIDVATSVTAAGDGTNTCNATANFHDSGYAGCAIACASGSPVARFYGSPTQTCTGTSVQFHDQSLFGGASPAWNWAFGDGAGSVAQNPAHAYAIGGAYSVSLTVTGGNTLTKTNYITVCPYAGDFDRDTDVDGTDFQVFYTYCIAGTPSAECDINGDGNVDANDMKNFGLMDCMSCS